MNVVELDGSSGEGGGQILRSALALSIVTGRPCRVENLRAGREKPGLQPQHLMAVQAAAAICDAAVDGAHLHSRSLTFHPGPVQPGDYRFDVGTAGSAPLVVQTVYLPLARAATASTLTLTGGTHVPQSPSFHYLELVWRPFLAQIGFELELALERAGFYPPGGGEIRALIQPLTRARPLVSLARGDLQAIEGVSAVANLPLSIAARQRNQALQRLNAIAPAVGIELETLQAVSPGTMLGLLARFEHGHAGFFALGARGKPAEQVADEAVDALFEFLTTTAVLDPHAADQLLLPLALADGASALSVSRITRHLLTNRDVVRAFLPVTIEIDGEMEQPGVLRIVPGALQELGADGRTAAWNVVVTVREGGYRLARRALSRFGRLRRTDFYNVLVLTVEDSQRFLEDLRAAVDADPALAAALAHVMPVDRTFVFQTVPEFETKARDALLPLAGQLSGRRFHVRIHRRGFRDRMSRSAEERQLADALLEQLRDRGTSATVDFDDPDAVVVLETVGQQAGLAVWERAQRARYPFVHPD